MGTRDPILLRACSELALEDGNLTQAAGCSKVALRIGCDSVWHLLRLAYVAARMGQSLAEVQALMDEAIVAAESPTDRAILGWHLSFRAPGFPAAPRNPMDRSKTRRLVFAAVDEWLLASAEKRLQIFWQRMDQLAEWSGVGSGIRYVYADFFSIIPSGGDFSTCTAIAGYPMYWYPDCQRISDVALPHQQSVTLLARPIRLWDPESGRLVAVIPYALGAGAWRDGDDSDQVTLTVHDWGADALPVELSRYLLPEPRRSGLGDDDFITGYLTLPLSTAAPVAWQLLASRGEDGVITSTTTALRELTGDSVVLSDLILGPLDMGIGWNAGARSGDAIVVFPAAVVQSEGNELELEVQSNSSVSLPAVRCSILVQRVGARGNLEEDAFTLSWQMPIEQGIHMISRSIDATELSSGTYQVKFAVNLPYPTSEATVVRRARFTIP